MEGLMEGLMISYGLGFVIGWIVCWSSDVIKIPALFEAWLEQQDLGDNEEE